MSVVTSHLFRGLHRHLQEHGYDASSAAFREVSLEAEETHNSSVIVGECAAQASHRVFATQHANKTWQMRARRGECVVKQGHTAAIAQRGYIPPSVHSRLTQGYEGYAQHYLTD